MPASNNKRKSKRGQRHKHNQARGLTPPLPRVPTGSLTPIEELQRRLMGLGTTQAPSPPDTPIVPTTFTPDPITGNPQKSPSTSAPETETP